MAAAVAAVVVEELKPNDSDHGSFLAMNSFSVKLF